MYNGSFQMRNRKPPLQFSNVEPPRFYDHEFDFEDDEDKAFNDIIYQLSTNHGPLSEDRGHLFGGEDDNKFIKDGGGSSIAASMSRIFAPQIYGPTMRSSPCTYQSPTRVLFIIISILFTLVIFIQVLLTRHYKIIAPLVNVKTHIKENTVPPILDKKVSVPNNNKVLDQWTHAGDVVGLYKENSAFKESNIDTIAIGCAVTTRHMKDIKAHNIAQTLPFFRSLLSGFCKTASEGFDYHFYVAYDISDHYFTQGNFRALFSNKFEDIVRKGCPKKVSASLHMVSCGHVGHPAWAQNDAMMEAYLDDMEYYYRVNDDSYFNTKGWTERFIEALKSFDPPNIGVVGPGHFGGNEFILTHDFVHKTHMEIFGFYYPRTFGQWWADDWITYVYQPGRSYKVDSLHVTHTGERGTRYNHTSIDDINIVNNRVKQDQEVLQRYIASKKTAIIPGTSSPSAPSDQKRIISMSLYGNDPKYTYGAIRNAQLLPVVFPGWTLRVYVEKASSDRKYQYGAVPKKILKKLQSLNAEVIAVDVSIIQAPPMMWRFLVADDMTVDYFIVRDADSRLSSRDAKLVEEWVKSGTSFHCVRDHPSHVSDPVYGGLWGAKPKQLRSMLVTPIHLLMKGYGQDYGQDIYFMSNSVWPRVRMSAFCHDSIACNKFPLSQPIVEPRMGQEHVGQVFDAFSEPRQIDLDILKYTSPSDFCVRSSQHGGRVPPLSDHHDSHHLVPPGVGKYLPEEEVEAVIAPSSFSEIVIWTMDYHISPIMDIKNLLMPMGVRFIDKSLSSMCKISQTCAKDLQIVGRENAMDPSSELTENFVEHYQNSEEMKRVTHVLCVSPPAMCEMYAKLNKSMILLATNRYEEGRVELARWQQWNKILYQISWNKKNVIAANNHYDVEYLRYFTGLHAEYIPSYCGYTNVSYAMTKSEYLLMPIKDDRFRDWFAQELNNTIATTRVNARIKFMRDLYPVYNYSDLASHAGIVYVPYQVSMISMCEHYRMNIPLFFPTLNLLTRWHKEYGVITNRTFNQQRHLLGHDGMRSPLSGVSGRFDPNDEEDDKSIIYWLRYADFYQWPYIIHYDSIDHLVYLLESTNLPASSYKMKNFNMKFKSDVSKKWIEVLKKTT